MFCIKCGKELSEGMNFCTSCGAPQREKVIAATGVKSNLDRKPEKDAVRKKKGFSVWIIGVVLLVITFLTALFFGVFSESAKIRRELNAQCKVAQRYLDELDYEQAVAAYKAVLEMDPNNEKAMEGLEKAYQSWAASVEDPQKCAEICIEAEQCFIGLAHDAKTVEIREQYERAAQRILNIVGEDNTELSSLEENEDPEQIPKPVWSIQLTTVGANEGTTLSGVDVAFENNEGIRENKTTDGAGRITIELPVREESYRIECSKDGYYSHVIDVSGDMSRIVALVPQVSNGDACVLLEWNGEQNLDLCAFDAEAKEYVNIAHPMDESGDFLYADKTADDGYELLYIRDIDAKKVRSIYVLDREAARQDISSGMEADGVNLCVYTSEGMAWNGKANPGRGEALWRPIYFFDGGIYEEEEYISDLSAYTWVSLDPQEQVSEKTISDSEWKQAYLNAVKDYKGYDIETISLGYINNDTIPELFIRSGLEVEVFSYKNGQVNRIIDDACGDIYYIEKSGKIMYWCQGGDYSGEHYSLYSLGSNGFNNTGNGSIARSIPEWDDMWRDDNYQWVKVDNGGAQEIYEAYYWNDVSYLSWDAFRAAMNKDFEFNKASVYSMNFSSYDKLVKYLSQ